MVDDGEGFSHFPSPDSTGGIGAKVASEEENIDSWDVSPNSGRWNVTSDNNTDDLVTDSILRMTTVNKATSDDITSGVGFEMDRGMRKTDGKVEYRMASSGGGNQTEYFRDEIGDKADFEEGDTEGFARDSGATATITSESGLLKIEITNAITTFIRVDVDVLLDAFVYPIIKVRIKASEPMEFQPQKQGPEGLLLAAAEFGTEWVTLTLDDELVADGSWNGQITQFFLTFVEVDGNFEADEIIWVEFVEIIGNLDYATHIENEIEDTWDFEEGDGEGWARSAGDTVTLTDAGGFLKIEPDGTSNFANIDETGMFIDSSLFDFAKLRINASENGLRVAITDGVNALTAFTSLTTTLVEYTFTFDSDWTGTETAFGISIAENSGAGNFDGDEVFFVDYALLLGHWADSDSVMGLWDQDDLVPLLNVSTHFTSNNSHPTTSEKAYFTVELLDEDGDIAYSATSANFTDISDLWIQAKITYDVLRSKITVTINADNLTRIDKWTYPDDFTEVSGRIPALFSHEKPPYVFTSTFCVATSWLEMKLDFITAPFEERKWTQGDNPTDADWLTDSTFSCFVQDDIDDSADYGLIVPYLDAVSASMNLNYTKPANLTNNDEMVLGFLLQTFDADDGENHWLLSVSFRIIHEGGVPNLDVQVLVGDLLLTTIYSERFSFHTNPRMDFGISIYDERTRMLFRGLFTPDSTDETIAPLALTSDVFIPDEVDLISQEFEVQVFYGADFDGDIEYTGLFDEFDFIFRDSLRDIPMKYTPEGKKGVDPFTAMFILFADLVTIPLKAALFLIETAIGTLQTALTVAINAVTSAITTLQTTLGTAIGLVKTAVDAVTTAVTTMQAAITGALATLETAVGAVTTAIGLLAADIATAVWDGIGTALDFITDAMADIAADIWTAFGTAASDIMDDIITALTALASDVADFLDAMIAFLIPLLVALAEDLAGLIEDVIAFLLPLLGAIAGAIISFIADVVFFLWDALSFPDILAIIDLFLVGFVQFVTGVPIFMAAVISAFQALFLLVPVVGFIAFFIFPIAQGDSIGGYFTAMFGNMGFDITFGISILGNQFSLPAVLPWVVVCIGTVLIGTPFLGFF